MFLAAVTATLLLPPAGANAWIDFLRIENARLEPEVEELELKEMERRYRAGLSIRVAQMDRSSTHMDELLDRVRHRLAFDYEVIRAIREGRTSPEAFVELLVIRAQTMRLVEAAIEARLKEREWMESENRRRSGQIRPRVDPDRFPELSKLVRQNLDLWARKRYPGR